MKSAILSLILIIFFFSCSSSKQYAKSSRARESEGLSTPLETNYQEIENFVPDTVDLYSTLESDDAGKHLKIEIVDKVFFDSVNTIETIQPEKKHEKIINSTDSAFSVKLGNRSIKEFADNNCDCDLLQEYTYEGHYDFIDVFVIAATYWEEYLYEIYSCENGNHLLNFGGEVNVSPDRRYLFSLSPAVYDDFARLDLIKVNDGTLKEESSRFFLFTNWSATGDIRWIDDSTFVTPVLFKPFRNQNGEFSKNYRYLKVTLL